MNNSSLFRIGGVAAIASGVLYIVTLALGIAGSSGMSRPAYILSSLLFIVTIGVLTVTLMPRNRALAILAFILLGGTTLWSMTLDPTAMDASVWPLATIYGLGFLLYGWLQFSGDARALGILALVTGALSVIAGVVLLAGASVDIFGLFNLALTIPFAIWLIWMGWVWLRGKAAPQQQPA